MHRFLIFLIPSLIFISCKNPVTPVNNITPGRRDYTWTIDTLNSPPNLFDLVNIWGSGPSDVWAVGTADETLNSLWHYDGISWNRTTQRLSSNLWSVYGFSQNNIWMCDSPGGDIFHYDGISWEKVGNFVYPGYDLLYLDCLWGDNFNDLYLAGGAYSKANGTQIILMKYVNQTWAFIQLPKYDCALSSVRKNSEDNTILFSGIKFSSLSGDTNKVLAFDGTVLKELYSGLDNATVCDINGNVYINIKNKLYKYAENKLALWKDFDGTSYRGRVWGRNENDFFGVGYDGLVHYNGTDLKTIFPTTMLLDNLLVLDKDIFLLYDSRIIVHGHLK